MESRTDLLKAASPPSDQVSRHIMLSKTRGMITELEVVGAPTGDIYVIRHWDASQGTGRILETGSWIGFRYQDAHWSFVMQ